MGWILICNSMTATVQSSPLLDDTLQVPAVAQQIWQSILTTDIAVLMKNFEKICIT